jgi:two-component system, NarL family, invasion response regulator UvrY
MHFLIVDDHDSVRRGLRDLLHEKFEHASITEAQSGEEALLKLGDQEWNLIFLDLSLPGRNGLDILRDIKKFNPNLPVAIVSSHCERLYASRSLELGASGYISKERALREVLPATECILQGGQYFPEETVK